MPSPPDQPPLLCIMGPTAAGKTALAIALAEHLDGELISVDSAMVYRGLDIGAAKPDYPHHLIDIRDPATPYSAAEFVRDATERIEDIGARGRLPILVGGTQLYFRALLQGLDAMPATDPEVRSAIEDEAAKLGWPALHAELAQVDAVSAARIHPNHSARISRALAVWRQSGHPISQWQTGEALPQRAHVPVIVTPADRRVLHQRIAERFLTMMEAGLLDEVRRLHARTDLHSGLPSVRAVGYRQIWAHLEGEVDVETATQQAIAATRQLAKRQLTWLRSWPGGCWLETDGAGRLLATTIPIPKTRGAAHVCPSAPQKRCDSLLEAALYLWRNCSAVPES